MNAMHEPWRPAVELDLGRLECSGHLVPAQGRSVLAEEFRCMKRTLLENARRADAVEKRLPMIMVTSALPGEGKTFFSINLAMSVAAEIDTSVLLVDADVVRPGLMNRLGLGERRGLLDLLADPALDIGDVMLETNVPKLSILPAGTRTDMATELLASDAMERLLAALPARYPGRVVVFDAPPLLVASEARVLASRVGQVVLVVMASHTPRAAVAQAFAAAQPCPIVMAVLNKAAEPAAPLGCYAGRGGPAARN
jgi:receptor protein-tyrosine kinase